VLVRKKLSAKFYAVKLNDSYDYVKYSSSIYLDFDLLASSVKEQNV